MKMLDGEGLAAFVAVADARSFSRAAERLGLAQSVVSKRLKRLEDRLGIELVDRTVRTNVRLTRVGGIFLPEAVQTLAQIENAERTGRNLARGSCGPIRIGFVFSAALNGVLVGVLDRLRSTLPKLRVELQLMETPHQLAALESARLDLAIVRPRLSYPHGCVARVVHSERLRVCLSSHNELSYKSSLQASALSGERFIVPQFHENVGLIDNIRRLATFAGFDLPQIIRTTDYVTSISMVAANIGAALVPSSLDRLQIDGVAYRNIDDFDELIDTVLVTHASAPEEAVRNLSSFQAGV